MFWNGGKGVWLTYANLTHPAGSIFTGLLQVQAPKAWCGSLRAGRGHHDGTHISKYSRAGLCGHRNMSHPDCTNHDEEQPQFEVLLN